MTKITKKTAAKISAKEDLKRLKASSSAGKRSDGINIILKELMDITYAEKFLEEMNNNLSSGVSEFNIDAGNVTRITTPCIQVILSTQVQAQNLGVRIMFSEVSDVFEKAFADLGLSEKLSKMKG